MLCALCADPVCTLLWTCRCVLGVGVLRKLTPITHTVDPTIPPALPAATQRPFRPCQRLWLAPHGGVTLWTLRPLALLVEPQLRYSCGVTFWAWVANKSTHACVCCIFPFAPGCYWLPVLGDTGRWSQVHLAPHTKGMLLGPRSHSSCVLSRSHTHLAPP